MDRQYLRPHKVNVYQGDKLVKVVRTKPYSIHGFDSYKVEGRLLPGYVDRADSTADACVFLEEAT
jgi:hypothetical protein